MLFKREFHERIASGEVTVTFRAWSKAMAVVGHRYSVPPIGAIVVESVTRTKLAAVNHADARASGFAEVVELVSYLSKTSGRKLSGATPVFRVAFHHEPPRPADSTERTEVDRGKVERALSGYDRRSPHGPWTQKTLALIARSPGVSSAILARTLKRERLELKADIRKLKKLGLLDSLETGYRITPLGKSIADRANDHTAARGD